MAIVIEDAETVRRIEQLALGLNVTPVEAVRTAVTEQVASLIERQKVHRRKATPEEFRGAVRRAQEAVRDHGNLDRRSPDEILGYNEHGCFD